MMTGQGRELEAGENMGAMGGFVSAKEEKDQNQLWNLKHYHVWLFCFDVTNAPYLSHVFETTAQILTQLDTELRFFCLTKDI